METNLFSTPKLQISSLVTVVALGRKDWPIVAVNLGLQLPLRQSKKNKFKNKLKNSLISFINKRMKFSRKI